MTPTQRQHIPLNSTKICAHLCIPLGFPCLSETRTMSTIATTSKKEHKQKQHSSLHQNGKSSCSGFLSSSHRGAVTTPEPEAPTPEVCSVLKETLRERLQGPREGTMRHQGHADAALNNCRRKTETKDLLTSRPPASVCLLSHHLLLVPPGRAGCWRCRDQPPLPSCIPKCHAPWGQKSHSKG